MISNTPAISVFEPKEQGLPVVLSCPHAGAVLPTEMLELTALSEATLLQDSDFGVDVLVERAAQDLGVPLVQCLTARAYVDVNRASDELDPNLFDDEQALPFHKARSPRVAAGLGVLPTKVGGKDLIYGERKLSLGTLEERLAKVHLPYHQALAKAIARTREKFGFCILLDCHSMPAMTASASFSLRRDRNPFRLKQVPGEGQGLSTGAVDAVLGDRFGATCAKPAVLSVLHKLWHHGLMVEWNRPYAGGYIIKTHGNRAQDVHALQFELSRDLYLDQNLKPGPNHEAVRLMVHQVIQRLGALDPAVLRNDVEAQND